MLLVEKSWDFGSVEDCCAGPEAFGIGGDDGFENERSDDAKVRKAGASQCAIELGMILLVDICDVAIG